MTKYYDCRRDYDFDLTLAAMEIEEELKTETDENKITRLHARLEKINEYFEGRK